MSPEEKIESALMLAANDFLTANATIDTETGLPLIGAGSIAQPNIEFDSKGHKVWAAIWYFPNSPVSRTIGHGGIDELTGFVQIDINVNLGTGGSKRREWERKGRIYFRPGRSFIYQTQSVTVTQSGMSPGRPADGFFRSSFTINFIGDVKRYVTA